MTPSFFAIFNIPFMPRIKEVNMSIFLQILGMIFLVIIVIAFVSYIVIKILWHKAEKEFEKLAENNAKMIAKLTEKYYSTNNGRIKYSVRNKIRNLGGDIPNEEL